MNLTAKIKDYTVTEAKNGNAQVAMQFEATLPDGSTKNLTWFGSFAGGAKEITLKTLLACGLKDFRGLGNLINGVSSNLLDCQKELTLDVQEEQYTKQDGTPATRTVVKWVNDPATAPAMKKIDPAKNMQFFNTMGFDQDLMRLSQEMGTNNSNANQNQNMQNNNMQNNQQMNNQNMNQNQNVQNNNMLQNGQMHNGNMNNGTNQNQNMQQNNMNGNGQNLPF